MKSNGKSRRMDSRQAATEDEVSSDEWFTRYLVHAVVLVILVLTAIGIALYFDRGEYLRDWNREPQAGFLMCLLLCPMLGVVTLVLAVYAGIRLFLRPYTLGHAFIRLTFLVAHVSIFLVCADTISSTATTLTRSLAQSSSSVDPTVAWRDVDGRDFSGSSSDGREIPPFSPPSGMGISGLGISGPGPGSR